MCIVDAKMKKFSTYLIPPTMNGKLYTFHLYYRWSSILFKKNTIHTITWQRFIIAIMILRSSLKVARDTLDRLFWNKLTKLIFILCCVLGYRISAISIIFVRTIDQCIVTLIAENLTFLNFLHRYSLSSNIEPTGIQGIYSHPRWVWNISSSWRYWWQIRSRLLYHVQNKRWRDNGLRHK